MKIWSRIFYVLWWYSSQKVLQKSIFNRVVLQFQEKVGSTGVLSGEHMVHVVVAGVDKATISMLIGHASEQMFLKIASRLNGQ